MFVPLQSKLQSRTKIVLDPWSVLPIRNLKIAKTTNEIVLCNLNGTNLSNNFATFENLEVLWLNKNFLKSLANLENNFRIQEMYVQNNRLIDISGIRGLKFLRVLSASDNLLSDLDFHTQFLTNFNYLIKLDLKGNPLSNENGYTYKICNALPKIQLLDNHRIRESDRISNVALLDSELLDVEIPINLKSKNNPKLVSKLSGIEKFCFKEAKKIKHKWKIQQEEKYRRMIGGGKAYFSIVLPISLRSRTRGLISSR